MIGMYPILGEVGTLLFLKMLKLESYCSSIHVDMPPSPADTRPASRHCHSAVMARYWRLRHPICMRRARRRTFLRMPSTSARFRMLRQSPNRQAEQTAKACLLKQVVSQLVG